MSETAEPCIENNFLAEHAKLLISSFFQLTGKHLVNPESLHPSQAVFEAAFCVVSHNTDEDPVFNYANKAALELFEMTWSDFTKMASRNSAEPENREERRKLLARVRQDGFIDNYRGIRISSSGKRFLVENSIVWNLVDEYGECHGQAAALCSWTTL